MERFIERHDERIIGVLSGFDRILFRGTIRALSYVDGMDKYLNVHGVLYKHFGGFVQRISNKIKEHAAEYAAAHDRPFRYLMLVPLFLLCRSGIWPDASPTADLASHDHPSLFERA